MASDAVMTWPLDIGVPCRVCGIRVHLLVHEDGRKQVMHGAGEAMQWFPADLRDHPLFDAIGAWERAVHAYEADACL